jgi:hypothetical protein
MKKKAGAKHRLLHDFKLGSLRNQTAGESDVVIRAAPGHATSRGATSG